MSQTFSFLFFPAPAVYLSEVTCTTWGFPIHMNQRGLTCFDSSAAARVSAEHFSIRAGGGACGGGLPA